ncbi:hypothetical protein HZF24_02695 [Sedimentibacter hydroxybenzoicus DSM 7310]|uniref:Uncharacterized protein n=1 Tax=Sedimentibacter hydroxybenzoicus DSM 7310 TaxID=1123245 RepID=A0A974GV82_SEDHY|nr:hypothetical protein [Sedimentibacter hydroxybenzoicus]NYB73044.1 hypothetical protein [Sedimentibacter hydroxybenzoicus DSM 7310]
MEQRKNNFTSLLLYSLKSKKNWFLLSTVIILITTTLIPFILGIEGEVFIAFGIVEIFILVFVNCLVDNSFLHNDSKLAYYKSKPVSLKNQIFINIINNHILTVFLLALVLLSKTVQNSAIELLEVYKFVIPWLSVGIFLSALSSVLSGNTVAAGLMTIFNFALPGIFYLIIYFMFSILADLIPGFSADVLMEYFVDAFYKLDYIYLIVYTYNRTIDVLYFLILGSIIAFITLLIIKMVKRRKNENTGSFMAFDGYKYFVAVLASLIIPALFTMEFYGSVVSKMTVALLLAALSYYLIIAIMEKAFRISKLSIKVFLVSMTAFIVLTGATVLIATPYKNTVPDSKDVKVAYIGVGGWHYRVINNAIKEQDVLDDEKLAEFEKRYNDINAVLFKNKGNIENITRMHREVLNNQGYNSQNSYMNNMTINYYMNDGSMISREYRTINDANAENKVKDEIAAQILKSDELKEKTYFYLYDEDYFQRYKDSYKLELRDESGTSIDGNIDMEQLRLHLIKDIDGMFNYSVDGAFEALCSYDYQMPSMEKYSGYIEISIEDGRNNRGKSYYSINLGERFVNTREFLGIE